MSYHQELFLKKAKGNDRFWRIATEGAEVIVTHGQIVGAPVETRTTSKGKSIGKKNETTPEEQAIKEAQSKWTAQVDLDDYHWDIRWSGRQMRPQLAVTYKLGAIDYNVGTYSIMPKLDGLRLLKGQRYLGAGEYEFMSRKGLVYNVKHLHAPCAVFLDYVAEQLPTTTPCRGLDGEMYIHGLPVNQINSRSKKYKKGLTEELKFHLFDLYIDGVSTEDRYDVLVAALVEYKKVYPECQAFELVESYTITSDEEMKSYHDRFVEMGYEGGIIRRNESVYTPGKHIDIMWKFKVMFDDEFMIIDMTTDKNGNAMWVISLPAGKVLASGDTIPATRTCNVTPKRTHEERKQMLEDPSEYVGHWGKVQYQGMTEYGSLEFPSGREKRICNDQGEPLE